jgi:hypothetical protein
LERSARCRKAITAELDTGADDPARVDGSHRAPAGQNSSEGLAQNVDI